MSDSDYPEPGTAELQVALLRRAADYYDAVRERCRTCRRTPLVGERVYVDPAGLVYCELCRVLGPEPALQSKIVHGPEFGHTMRLTDRRGDYRAA